MAASRNSSSDLPRAERRSDDSGPWPATYGVRQCFGALPWGRVSGGLPYEASDMGGADAVAPAAMLAGSGSTFWLRDPILGRVYAANPVDGTTGEVDLAATAELGDVPIVAFAMARLGDGDVAVLVGGAERGSTDFFFGLCVFTAMGNLRRFVALPALSAIRDGPVRVGIVESGVTWVSYTWQTVALDPEGHPLRQIDAGGLLTAEGMYIACGEEPALYAGDGSPRGKIAVPDALWPASFLAAGPGGILLAEFPTVMLPEHLDEDLSVFGVFRLEDLRLELHDYVAWPTMTLQVRPDADGAPVHSYFPLESATFDAAGDLYVLEHTASDCRFHVCRRLTGRDAWQQKFLRLVDLSAAELELHRSESMARLGRWSEAGTLGDLFRGAVWAENAPPSDRQRMAEYAPVLRVLREASPSLDRRRSRPTDA